MKKCKCGETRKDLFSKNRSKKDGLQTACNPCRVKIQKEYAKRNPQIIRLNNRKTRLALYNITQDQYNKMVKDQNNCCAICNNPENILYKGKLKLLCVDHCKYTKIVRGLLCSNCNRGIGYLKHDLSLLNSSIVYLTAKNLVGV